MTTRLTPWNIPVPVMGMLWVLIVGLSIGLIVTPYVFLALLPALGLFVFLLLLNNPHWGFYAIVFLIPFGAYRGLTGTYEYVRAHWIMAFMLIVILVLRDLRSRDLAGALRSNLWPPLLLMIPVFIISALLSPYPQTAYSNVVLLLAAYGFVALSMIFIRPDVFLRALPLVIVLSVSIGAFLAIIGYLTGTDLFAMAVTGSFRRGIGASSNPNNMAMMILFALPLVVYLMVNAETMPERAFFLGLALVNIGGLSTTFSRSGALVFVIVLVGLFFENRLRLKPQHLGLFVVGAGLFVLFILAVVPSYYWERERAAAVPGEDRAISRRMSYYIVARDAFVKRPVLGWGPGTFREIFPETGWAIAYHREGESIRRFAHNTYLEFLVGTGAIGLLLYLLINFVAFRNFSRAKRAFLEMGDLRTASLIGSYRLSFITILLYLFFFSDMFYKYILLSLAISHAAHRLATDSWHSEEYVDGGSER